MLDLQKQKLIAKFKDELERLTPVFSSPDEITSFKMDACKTAIRKLEEPGLAVIPDILNDRTTVEDENGNVRSFTRGNIIYSTCAEAMTLERGHFAAKSAEIWKDVTTNYKKPADILQEMLLQEENQNVLNQ